MSGSNSRTWLIAVTIGFVVLVVLASNWTSALARTRTTMDQRPRLAFIQQYETEVAMVNQRYLVYGLLTVGATIIAALALGPPRERTKLPEGGESNVG